MPPRRHILVLETSQSPWLSFLEAYFHDVPSQLDVFGDASHAGRALDGTHHDIALLSPALLSLAFTQKLAACRQGRPEFRCFQLGAATVLSGKASFDRRFEELPGLPEFGRLLVEHLPYDERVRVLVVDDEEEIGRSVCDYLDRRTNPVFDVEYVRNGEEGLRAIERRHPDVLILDIKMPVLDGREVYREIQRRNWKFPVLVFFDAISSEEMLEMRRIGNPIVLEKGSRQSAMPEMMSLVKKLVYFG